MTELTAIRIRLRHRKGCGEISTAFLSLIYHIQICRFHDVHAFSVAMSLAILMQLCCQNYWAKSRPFDHLKNEFQKPFDRHLTDIRNLEILKAAKSDEKNSFSEEKLLFRWQPKKDSNPHKQSQSLSCYLYTIRLYSLSVLATCILYYGNTRVSSTFFENFIFPKEERSTPSS